MFTRYRGKDTKIQESVGRQIKSLFFQRGILPGFPAGSLHHGPGLFGLTFMMFFQVHLIRFPGFRLLFFAIPVNLLLAYAGLLLAG